MSPHTPGYFYAIRCVCGCIHGWITHPAVRKVTRESRTAMETVWYCPACGRQHRTTDGTWLGQPRKAYEEITDESQLPTQGSRGHGPRRIRNGQIFEVPEEDSW